MSYAVSTTLFGSVVESLLATHVICAYSNAEAFSFIEGAGNEEAIDRYVRQIGRTLSKTADKKAYYLSLIDVSTPAHRESVIAHFNEVVNIIGPVIQFLMLDQSARQDLEPLATGARLSEGELLSLIDNSPALKDGLSLLVRNKVFKTTKSSTRDQLAKVLDVLCANGYLQKNTPTGNTYTGLGKLSLFYDVLAFIQSHESIGDDDPASSKMQDSLL